MAGAITAVVILAASQMLFAAGSHSDYSTALYEAALATITGNGISTLDPFSRILQVILAIYSVVVFATLAGSLGAYFLRDNPPAAAPGPPNRNNEPRSGGLEGDQYARGEQRTPPGFVAPITGLELERKGRTVPAFRQGRARPKRCSGPSPRWSGQSAHRACPPWCPGCGRPRHRATAHWQER